MSNEDTCTCAPCETCDDDDYVCDKGGKEGDCTCSPCTDLKCNKHSKDECYCLECNCLSGEAIVATNNEDCNCPLCECEACEFAGILKARELGKSKSGGPESGDGKIKDCDCAICEKLCGAILKPSGTFKECTCAVCDKLCGAILKPSGMFKECTCAVCDKLCGAILKPSEAFKECTCANCERLCGAIMKSLEQGPIKECKCATCEKLCGAIIKPSEAAVSGAKCGKTCDPCFCDSKGAILGLTDDCTCGFSCSCPKGDAILEKLLDCLCGGNCTCLKDALVRPITAPAKLERSGTRDVGIKYGDSQTKAFQTELRQLEMELREKDRLIDDMTAQLESGYGTDQVKVPTCIVVEPNACTWNVTMTLPSLKSDFNSLGGIRQSGPRSERAISRLCSSPSKYPLCYDIDVTGLEITDILKETEDSILVRWKPPHNISKILGYEVYVNNLLKAKIPKISRKSVVVDTTVLKTPIDISVYAISLNGRCMPPALATYIA